VLDALPSRDANYPGVKVTEKRSDLRRGNFARRFALSAAIASLFLQGSCPNDPTIQHAKFSSQFVVVIDRWSNVNSADLASDWIGEMQAGVPYDIKNIDYSAFGLAGNAPTDDRSDVTAALQLTSLTEQKICATKKHDAALIYIHGYETVLGQSLLNADAVTQKYGEGRDVYLWSWFSHGHVGFDSLTDAQYWARGSGRRLHEFVAEMSRCYRSGTISILAHSMGGEVVMGMLSRDEETPLLTAQANVLENLILVAPYSGRGEFDHRQKQIESLFRKTTVYQVEDDEVLGWGSLVNPFLSPIGSYNSEDPTVNMFNAADKIDVVVAARYSEDMLIRHQPYLRNDLVIKDIYAVLHGAVPTRCLVHFQVSEEYDGSDQKQIETYYGVGKSCNCWPDGSRSSFMNPPPGCPEMERYKVPERSREQPP
jgi:esterase/lipase superfamily enzyme